MRSRLLLPALVVVALLAPWAARAAGTLTPLGSPDTPIVIRSHHVGVVVNNGFSRTEVIQTFYNPNPEDLEGLYAFPVPIGASLSEVTIVAGDRELHGEVVPRNEARRLYEEEKSRGHDTGLATREGYRNFEFRVSPIRARGETQLRFVYYQRIEIDTGIARYLYPLEEGGTDELAKQFWTSNDRVEGLFSAEIELKSAWAVTNLRVPGFEKEAVFEELAEGHYRIRIDRPRAKLDRDLLLYYRLADGLPGRAELVAYRAETAGPGTFMLVVTPGVDLQEITGGADTVFVLDVSASMAGKIHTLADGVVRALGELDARDRFRVVTFSSTADELTRGWVAATPENVRHWAARVKKLGSRGGTNLYEGLDLGLRGLDTDRATSLVLVTDAVTNTGIVDPKRFHELASRHDVRVFGFLMGNSANWPLMRLICEASGGFHAQISNADDVIGQLMLAKSKVTHEALHGARLDIDGVPTHETTGAVIGKVYRGQQLVLFGRYTRPGVATLRLRARLTGRDKTYQTRVEFPALAPDDPEIERLWAMSRIEETETLADVGLVPRDAARRVIRDLGVDYQLVTDETSMLVLSDESFARHGIERHNRARVANERAAQARRAQQPVVGHRVDRDRPMFDLPAPSLGGGAADPLTLLLALCLGAAGLASAGRTWGDERRRP